MVGSSNTRVFTLFDDAVSGKLPPDGTYLPDLTQSHWLKARVEAAGTPDALLLSPSLVPFSANCF
jgi:hypothetical protein